MKKFSNKANRDLAFKKGSTLIAYNHNGESLREKAIEMHKEGRIVYYENQKPSSQYPNGASHLYEVG